MDEAVRIGNYDAVSAAGGYGDRVMEWEDGLPHGDDLTPLSQSLIPPGLAFAFRISPEPLRTMLDVNRASNMTFASLQGGKNQMISSLNLNSFQPFDEDLNKERIITDDDTDLIREGSDSRKNRRIETGGGGVEEAEDSGMRDGNCGDGSSAKTAQKRQRLVWTPQLHKRFLDVVGHLGISKAVPKTIMELMNVEGLTRENVASHLQKYRLYLKRMQGFPNEGPSSASDRLFASTSLPQSLPESGHGHGHHHNSNESNDHISMPIPLPCPHQMLPMPLFGITPDGINGKMGNQNGGPPSHLHHQYYMGQQREWPGNQFGAYHHVPPTEK
ncbi:unnamed protein product [Cuscuta epithymum]|uniref:HTH myb-type domain-containing protein n=1 Tax=Cuscuta epithymum TaxID=186058 RepID=A0AAV0E885_9ASTE|nr:unnamed protein product [Cuscuta epithymum]